MVHVRSGEVRKFLQLTTELVPVGLEHLQVDLDHDLEELMWAPADGAPRPQRAPPSRVLSSM